MTNLQRLDEIIEMVENLTTEEIANAFFKKDRSGHFLCPWPEHNDKNGSSFHLNKNHTFKCFSCGRKVFSIHDYLREIYGIKDIKQSCLFIAFKCDLITEEEFLKLKTFQSKEKTFMNFKYQTKFEKENPKLKPLDIDTLDKIYSVFCLGKSLTLNKKGKIEIKPDLKLSKEHYEYLKNERQLSDEEICEYGYFTYPKYTFIKPFLKKMNELGYTKDVLIRVPGLFYNKEKEMINHKVFRNKEYIAIPIKNEDGKIRGIQLRADEVDEKQSRYIWVSSTNMDEKKFEGNLSPNSPIDVVYPKIKNPNTIAITEGHFKAIKISKTLNFISLSVQGVGNWKPILNTINNLKQKYPNITNIIIMYDADMSYKLQVLKAAINVGINILKFNNNDKDFLTYMKVLSLSTNENGNFDFNKNNLTLQQFEECKNNFITKLRDFHSDLNVSICVWDYHYGKGFDDFILNTNNINGFIYFKFSDFIYQLSFIFEELIGNNNVTQAEFFDLFKYYLLEEFVDVQLTNDIESYNYQEIEKVKGEDDSVPF